MKIYWIATHSSSLLLKKSRVIILVTISLQCLLKYSLYMPMYLLLRKPEMGTALEYGEDLSGKSA